MTMSQPTKKLINTVEHCVDDCLQGLVAIHSGLRLLKNHRVVVREDVASLCQRGQMTILSGGGAGHEPFAAGFVGKGMLTGAVSGSVFTSPPSGTILAAIRLLAVGNSGGTLVLACNYTGDRLNFGQAIEQARLEGLNVEMVIVAEDCGLMIPNKTVGRRGLCGVVLIQKIAGALAEENVPLQEAVKLLTQAANSMGTIGVSLGPCSLPGSGPLFQIPADEFELGLGIHGEAGVKKIKLKSAEVVIDKMIEHMTSPESTTRFNVQSGDRVVAVINNLGGLTQMEMNIIAGETLIALREQRGMHVERLYVGSLQTSLEMQGFTLTVMHVDNLRLMCLDAETSASGWKQLGNGLVNKFANQLIEPITASISGSVIAFFDRTADKAPMTVEADADLIRKVILHVCEELEGQEAKLNLLDSGCGDGDCGTTLKRGAEALVSRIETGIDLRCPQRVLLMVATIASEHMGGSSGALYSIFFTAAARALSKGLAPKDWCNCLALGVKVVMQYGGAAPGDRTVVDPLTAAHDMLKAQLEVGSRPVAALAQAVDAARGVTALTATMKPQAGRAAYVSAEHLTQPDAGAMAVTIVLQSILDVIKA